MLKVVNDFTNRWETNFNTLDILSCSLSDDVVDLDVTWVEAGVTESVEYSGWVSICDCVDWVDDIVWGLVKW